MALDERRVKFIPTFYTGRNTEYQETDPKVHGIDSKVHGVGPKIHKIDPKICRVDSEIHKFEHHVNNLYVEDTDAEEVFFAGAHCGSS